MGALFWQNTRFQIAAVCILVVVLFDFARRRRLRIRSSRFFSAMLALACFNLVFDVVTVYTISHPLVVPAWLNRLCHQLFIGSLDTLAYCLFLYVALISRSQRKLPLWFLLVMSLPYAAALALVGFGDLHYYYVGMRAYSYGPMAYSIFLCVSVYIVAIDIYIFHYRKGFSLRRRLAIIAATLIWIAVGVIQYLRPWLLLSGLGVALMLLYIYLTFENPNEHLDHDTACFTRRAFRLMLTELCSANKRFLVLYVTLYDLPQINNRHGHRVGEKLLREVSLALQGAFSEKVFHYRGNALTVIVPDERTLRERLDEFEEHMALPILVGRQRFQPAYHIDVMPCPQYAATSDEIFELLEYLYPQTEQDVSVPVHFVTDGYVAQKARAATVLRLVENAVANDGFEVVYQPIFSVSHGGFISAEALVRLRDRETVGFVPPDEFIPIAEQHGFIIGLGEAVLSQVCRFLSAEAPQMLGVRYVEVNLSGLQMDDPDLAPSLLRILAQYEISPQLINFEVTESVAVNSGSIFQQNMKALRDAGASFSLDDFGTGYSNLSRVAEERYDLIKFDKSLIWPCFGEEPDSPRIVLESIARMSNGLRLPIVAEGVETAEQALLLQGLGVEYMQGYLYAKPLPPEAFMALLRERKNPDDSQEKEKTK